MTGEEEEDTRTSTCKMAAEYRPEHGYSSKERRKEGRKGRSEIEI